jgi:MOSC domain-containing protein YiiM
MKNYKILGLFRSTPSQLPNNDITSIIKKKTQKLVIGFHGIDGDEVANKKHHGGDYRVIHHYSLRNYDYLKGKFPEIAEKFVGGSFGENILTEELTESDLNVGDIYQLGSARIQLTVSRRPCVTINHAYSDSRILKEIITSGRTGWFYRILEAGVVREDDELVLLDSPYPGLSVSKLHDQGYGNNQFSDKDFLKRCLATGLMDRSWQSVLEHNIVG